MMSLILAVTLMQLLSTPVYDVISCSNDELVLLEAVNPRYPKMCFTQRNGVVDLKATLDKKGNVTQVITVRSEPRRLFDKEARRALRKWKFNDAAHASRCIKVTFRFDADIVL